jgi:acyl-CoA thioesterase-2
VTSLQPSASFVDLLSLETIDKDIFRGRCHQGAPLRAFGGQVAAQALVAAGHTVENREVHSLHGYFIRPGDARQPIIYLAERTRDGRSFTTRRVTAVQKGEAIFSLSASFQKHEVGVEHQFPMPDVPGPESLEPTVLGKNASSDDPALDDEGIASRTSELVDLRWLSQPLGGRPAPATTRDYGQQQVLWLRAVQELPADPLLHVCVLAYLSDLTLAGTATLPHQDISLIPTASLDHAMWFHRPFKADEWLLFVQDSPSASGGRGLARGEFYRHDGVLVASVIQEALIRPAPAS